MVSMNEELSINTIKDCILEVWKGKLSYPFNHKDLEELEKIIDYYEKENQQLKSQLQQRDDVINECRRHVSSLSSKGRDCMIYADVKKDILDILNKKEDH